MDLERSLTIVSRRGEKRNVHAEDEEEDDGEEGGEAERKRVKLETATNDEEEAEAEPGAVLKVLNLPQTIDLEVITALFSRQDGFLPARTTKTEQGEEAVGKQTSLSPPLQQQRKQKPLCKACSSIQRISLSLTFFDAITKPRSDAQRSERIAKRGLRAAEKEEIWRKELLCRTANGFSNVSLVVQCNRIHV